jgi:hypothetical protein
MSKKKHYGEHRAINFEKLMGAKPTVYDTYTYNGQVVLCEHPSLGDEVSVIAYVEEHKVAWYTNFMDIDDLIECGGDYQQYFDAKDETVYSRFEVE